MNNRLEKLAGEIDSRKGVMRCDAYGILLLGFLCYLFLISYKSTEPVLSRYISKYFSNRDD